jgi:hypothetical protein
VLHGVPKGRTCEETLQAMEDRFREEHFAAAYRSQLKMRTQKVGESIQDFATVTEQLVHHACPALPEDHVRREAGNTFIKGKGTPIWKELSDSSYRSLKNEFTSRFKIQATSAKVFPVIVICCDCYLSWLSSERISPVPIRIHVL